MGGRYKVEGGRLKEGEWSNRRAGKYFNKDHSWITNHVRIANNLNTTLVTRVTNLDYASALHWRPGSPL